ncbi:MAG: hypothetical protein HW388_1660 [Dehalococcoidia bacterium]|nr:hypothetical protein [Dehalococcoidia bacterium]
MSSVGLQTFPDTAVEEEVRCVHYWIIDIPTGPVSKGECRQCGEVREFRNYLEYVSGWDDVRSFNSSPGERDSLRQLVGSAVEAEGDD